MQTRYNWLYLGWKIKILASNLRKGLENLQNRA
jgi:hypothetical protein